LLQLLSRQPAESRASNEQAFEPWWELGKDRPYDQSLDGRINMTRLLTVAFSFALVFVSANAQDRKTFTVGTATASRGQKAFGTIEVPGRQ